MVEKIKRTVIDIIMLFLLVMALVGYSEAQWPWMPEHGSRETVEMKYWEIGK